MTRFTALYPQFVGFDNIFNELERLVDGTTPTRNTSFPPHNIIKLDDNKYVVEMAVAGFAKTDLEITMDGNKLLVKGSTKDEEGEQFLYKGIANRGFERAFTLNDKVEIKDAELVNGMLKIWLENIVKAQDAIKKIGIKEKSE